MTEDQHKLDELIGRVSATGLDPEVARQAVGMILAFLRKDGPPADVDALFAAVPGAAEAAQAAAAAGDSGGGLLAGVAGLMGGGLMGLAGRLSGLGLGMNQMQVIGKEVFAFVRERAGDERVGQVAAAIPGLSQFL